MLLSVRFLNDVSGVNSFEPATSIAMNKGSAQPLYFQLVDKSLDGPTEGFNPPYRRYVPPAGSTLQVVLWNIDNAKKVTRPATQPFSGDLSIWMVPIMATDPLDGTVGLEITLNEPGRAIKAKLNSGLEVC